MAENLPEERPLDSEPLAQDAPSAPPLEDSPADDAADSAVPGPLENEEAASYLPVYTASPQVRVRLPQLTFQDWLVGVLLALILLGGGYLRFLGQNWDDFSHLHPDERFLTGVTALVQPVDSVDHFFDTSNSSMNPAYFASTRFYVYGDLPLFLVKAASGLVASLRGDPVWATYEGVHLVGRSVSALADILTIFFLFLIGRRLYSRWAGLLAAALYAFAVLPIQLSHFWTMDAFTTLPVVIAFWFAARTLQDGGWGNYAGFGIFLGMAVASRINVAPLAAVIGVAGLVRILPTFQAGVSRFQRQEVWGREIGGMILAGFVSLLSFRLGQPYAFTGSPALFTSGDMSAQIISLVWGLVWLSGVFLATFSFSERGVWSYVALIGATAIAAAINVNPLLLLATVILALLARAFFENSSEIRSVDQAMAWLMVRRTTLIVLFLVVVLTAGVVYLLFAPPVGVLSSFLDVRFDSIWAGNMAEVQRQVSGQVDMPPNHQWASRIPYLFPWWNMVMWGMGLPLGLMAWFALGWAGIQILRGRPGWTRHLLAVVWIVIFFGWQGRQWVMSMRYYLPLYPFLALFAAWALLTMAQRARAAWQQGPTVRRRLRFVFAGALLVFVTAITMLWAVGFSHIYTRQLTRVQASQWMIQNVPADFALYIDGLDGSQRMVNIGLYNSNLLPPDLPDDQDELPPSETSTRYFEDGTQYNSRFTAPITGTVSAVRATHLGDPLQDRDQEALWVAIWDPQEQRYLGEGTLRADFSQSDTLMGRAYDIAFDQEVTLVGGRDYELHTRADAGAPFIVAGAVIAWEGQWDDHVPHKVCALPDNQTWTPDTPPGLAASANDCHAIDPVGSGYYQYLKLQLFWDDFLQAKRTRMEEVLNYADYITISSNRFYDSLARIPTRFPMTLRYYQALFSGELGFELVQTFDSTFTWGSFEFSDQVLPIYDVPWWLNEWEPEEAFHVYDHPAVFVFRKTDAYDPQVAAAILDDVELARVTDLGMNETGQTPVGIVWWTAPQASASPTALTFPDVLWQRQVNGGTWSDIFDTSAAINQNEVLAVAVWWLTIVIFGWITWPILFAIFPALADRAYPMAKIAGLLLVSWLVWTLGSLGFEVWNSGGIVAAMIAVTLLSLYFAWRKRADLLDYLRQYWRRLLVFEVITLGLFLAFVLVRLGNPDLWHPNFGGEKPMDFAYFNAVLRSTVFPPIDPWYSGGYLNYYYYGFVLSGTPVKLWGLFPAIAYNLILPTWFAMTGMGAFSAAFNLTSRVRRKRDDGKPGVLLGSPWVAGTAALLLAVVLGNLDTIRVLAYGLLSGGDSTTGQFLPAFGGLGGDLFSGQALPIRTHWWYWNPTRVIVWSGGAITEIPYFSFLYGDPHAHMFAMPLTLLAIAWFFHEVFHVGAPANKRGPLATFLSLAIIALVTGILLPTNGWDWLTYTVLGAFGITLVNYLWHRHERRQALEATEEEEGALLEEPPPTPPNILWRIVGYFGGAPLYLAWESLKRLHPTRAALLRWVAHLLTFLALNTLFAMPFRAWFASNFNSATLWQGDKTPLWAYFDLHGLFLFLVISLLVWDTRRYLREIRVRQLVGLGTLVLMILFMFGWIMLIALGLTLLGYPVALVAVPLILWAAVLFFRPGQSNEMRVVWTLVILAISLTLAVEIFVLVGDIGRQNTVFKFYLQVWFLLSVVGGAAFAWLLRASEAWRGWLRNTWMTGATILFTIAAMYPLLATQAKLIDRMAPETPPTLNGMAFMQNAIQGENGEWFSLEEDYNVLRWLQENVEGSPVVLEGRSSREYLWGSRVAMFTGLPTLLGYRFHETQQRTIEPLSLLVDQRVLNNNMIYETPDIGVAWRLIKFFDIRLIVVGQLERVYYEHPLNLADQPLYPNSLSKFDAMVDSGLLRVIYQQGETLVYEVVPGAEYEPQSVGMVP